MRCAVREEMGARRKGMVVGRGDARASEWSEESQTWRMAGRLWEGNTNSFTGKQDLDG